MGNDVNYNRVRPVLVLNLVRDGIFMYLRDKENLLPRWSAYACVACARAARRDSILAIRRCACYSAYIPLMVRWPKPCIRHTHALPGRIACLGGYEIKRPENCPYCVTEFGLVELARPKQEIMPETQNKPWLARNTPFAHLGVRRACQSVVLSVHMAKTRHSGRMFGRKTARKRPVTRPN
jgi:hypothetical protein